MSANSKIEWTDHTFNSWIGCTKVSPACDHCYAEVSTPSRTLGVTWGAGQERLRTSKANWALPVRWNAQAEAFRAQHGRRQRVFCASLADVFDNAVPAQWRADLFALIALTPNLDWLLLTKRIGNAHEMIDLTMDAIDRAQTGGKSEVVRTAWPWPNVWLGATICNQEEADRDIPKLLRVPAAKRFLSIEPLLGPVDLAHLDLDGDSEMDALQPYTWETEIEKWRDTDPDWVEPFEDWFGHKPGEHTGPMHATLDWVIVGGESGTHARPMHPAWARSLRDQCAAAGVPFLFKQWGEWTPGENVERQRGTVDTAVLFFNEWIVRPLNLATDHGHIDDQPDLYRVGKKAAGRLLDGVQHDGYPA